MFKALGQWRGRQEEEKLASQFNYELIDRLKAMHAKDSKRPGWEREYMNIWHPSDAETPDPHAVNAYKNAPSNIDPVILDAYRLIPHDIKAHAQSVFGPEQLWVRKDLVDDVIGYRNASIGDFWTGNTRWSPKTQRMVQKLLANTWLGSDGKAT